jgi:hypothetical protein
MISARIKMRQPPLRLQGPARLACDGKHRMNSTRHGQPFAVSRASKTRHLSLSAPELTHSKIEDFQCWRVTPALSVLLLACALPSLAQLLLTDISVSGSALVEVAELLSAERRGAARVRGRDRENSLRWRGCVGGRGILHWVQDDRTEGALDSVRDRTQAARIRRSARFARRHAPFRMTLRRSSRAA